MAHIKVSNSVSEVLEQHFLFLLLNFASNAVLVLVLDELGRLAIEVTDSPFTIICALLLDSKVCTLYFCQG